MKVSDPGDAVQIPALMIPGQAGGIVLAVLLLAMAAYSIYLWTRGERSPKWLPIAFAVVFVFAVLVWIVAGAVKLPDPAQSVDAVRAYQLLPSSLVQPVVQLLPVVEIVVGATLVLGLLTRGSAIVSALLFVAFIIGIASVVGIVALGQGTQASVLDRISSIGTNTITVLPGSGFGDRTAGRIRTLTGSDADALATQAFADSVTPMIRPEDIVWVHDYHLIPLGDALRRRGCRNRIGFFLHIPWPPTRLFVSLPYHQRLVRTLLTYDLVGFQCDEWLGSFLHYCRTELGASVDEASGRIELDGKATVARAYPIGIDYEHFTAQGQTGEARQTAQRVISSTRRRTAMIGVDRLDYSKGLPEKLDGIGRFFDRYPDKVPDLVFIQIAPPSRSDLGSYQQIRAELERKTGQINGARSRIDLVPIRYVNQGHSAAELYGVYRACKIALVTPLRDGMNLVAKEYVAAQDPEDPGVLILSRFAGAAQQLSEALLVNPHSPDDIASGIRDAIEMPLDERKARWRAMHECVRDENVQRWAENFTRDLAAA